MPSGPPSLSSSAVDDESIPIGDGRNFLLFEAGHACTRRPLAQTFPEAVEPLGLAQGLDLHPAVRQIAHPAGEAPQLLRRPPREPAEAHALDLAADHDAAGPPHFPAFQPWRPSRGTKATSSPSLRRISPRGDLR